MPVDPSSSRFSISAVTVPPGKLRAAAARVASCFNKLGLSIARRSIATSEAERNWLIFIALPMWIASTHGEEMKPCLHGENAQAGARSR